MKNNRTAFIIAFTISIIVACRGKEKAHQTKETSLIEDAEQFHVDTIVMASGEVLCTPKVDHVLRHYPELYQATRKTKKLYIKSVEQELDFTKGGGYDISQLLDRALFGKDLATKESEWPDFSEIDSIYLQMIAEASTTEEKTKIGRARRAWKEYMKQLENVANALPEDCRPRFIEAIKEGAK